LRCPDTAAVNVVSNGLFDAATVPAVLTKIVASYDLLGGTPAPGDESAAIVESAAAGKLTPKELDG